MATTRPPACRAPKCARAPSKAATCIEEYHVAGQLRVVKITPVRGPVYYLVDSNGDGILDSSKGEGPISPVQYKLFSW